jgi:predicted transposase/invertase (TIGR01784 family)
LKTDTLLYRLFKQQPSLLFDLGVQPVPHPETYRFQSIEIKQTGFRIDGVFLPPDEETGSPIIFVELQFQKDEMLYGRLFSEAMLYLYRYKPKHDWRAVVIYPYENRDIGIVPHYREFFTSGRLQRLYLDSLPVLEGNNLGTDIIRLIVADDERVGTEVQRIKRRIAGQSEPLRSDWIDILETVLVYKWPRMTRDEVRDMLGEFFNVELKQTRFYQDVFSEGEQEGRQQGRQQGRQEGQQEGRQEGRQEGERLVLRRMLIKRFGPLPEWAEQRLIQADIAQLEQWTDRILDAPALDEALAR